MRAHGAGLSVVAPLAIAALAFGCAPLGPDTLAGSSMERWVGALTARRVDPASAVNPLEWTEPMRLEAERLAGRGGIRERLRALQDGLFDAGRFPFRYESKGTLTAREAFVERRGNCLSFTCLFIAMARSIGIEVRAASPAISEGIRVEGDLAVVSEHVVAAYPFHEGLELYDFDKTRERKVVGAIVLDDLRLAALYESNRGVDLLREGRAREAASRFEIATRLSPDLVSAWGNLGVARRRAGDVKGALDAYASGLEVEPRDAGILGNLAALHLSLGNEREARSAVALADPGGASAHFLVVRGDLERARGEGDRALRFYRKARRLAPDLAEPLVRIAALELERGRPSRARKAAARALEIDPGNETARALLKEASKP